MTQRITITLDYNAGHEPYVLSLLPQAQSIASDLLTGDSATTEPRTLDVLGVHVEVSITETPE